MIFMYAYYIAVLFIKVEIYTGRRICVFTKTPL